MTRSWAATWRRRRAHSGTSGRAQLFREHARLAPNARNLRVLSREARARFLLSVRELRPRTEARGLVSHMLRSLPLHDVTSKVAAPDSSLPVLANGFRPFFLLAALYAVVLVPLWLAVLSGKLAPSTYLPPITWHAHEMTWGFVTAVVAGFLLTAVG